MERLPYHREGECCRCGQCEDMSTLPIRLRIYELFGVDCLFRTEVCPHFYFDEHGRATCKIYDSPERDWMCKAFPASPVDIIALPRCGYHFIDEQGREILPALRRMALEWAEERGYKDVAKYFRRNLTERR